MPVTFTLAYYIQAKLDPTRVELFTINHSKGRLPALSANILPRWKTLAGYKHSSLLWNGINMSVKTGSIHFCIVIS
jgi:hypothetical protein